MPLSQIVSASIEDGAVAPVDLSSVAQYYGFKNRLINGSMWIWQRGTTFTNPATVYTADRWVCNRASNVTGIIVSQSTDVPSGFKYSLKLQRTAGNTDATNGLYIFNSNESINTLDLAGQTVTLSFWAKAGANYSGGPLSIVMISGTGTDQPVYAYTGSNTFSNTTQAITTTWTRYSVTATVPSNATELGFITLWTPTGTAGADDAAYFTGFQLEKGVTATSFDYRPYGTELALCKRYYRKMGGETAADIIVQGYNSASQAASCTIPLDTGMRVAPTVTQVGTWAVVSAGTTVFYSSSTSIGFQRTVSAAGTGGTYTVDTTTYLTLSAEL